MNSTCLNLGGLIVALFAAIYAITLGRRIRDLNRKIAELLELERRKNSGKPGP